MRFKFTPAAIAYGFGADRQSAVYVWVCLALLALTAAITIAYRVRDGFARFGAFSTLLPFVAGFFHEHDLLVAYPAVMWCALRSDAAAKPVALVATLLVAIDWLGLAQRPNATAQIALLAVATSAVFCSLAVPFDARLPAATSSLAALLVIAIALAHAHPMPVWPDALGHFNAPAEAGAATVWFEEQRATGLLAASPIWAALRCLPLLGCALLAFLIYRQSRCYRTA